MDLIGIYLRGVLMGAADIVPGVSGGTMAFITGIYDRLLGSIRAFDLALLRLLTRGRIKEAWEHVDGGFLLALVMGIGTSILTLARLISWLLMHHAIPLWAFFFGLILASALMLLRQVGYWNPGRIVSLVLGTGAALAVALSPRLGLEQGLAGVFVSGFVAICAMILPGISGSFILLLLGMYAPVLAAIHSLDLVFLAVFAAGAACGLMLFSRLLYWLLHRYHAGTLALLTGFLFGSLAVVWPWKETMDWVLAADGEARPLRQIPVLPADFLQLTGESPQLVLCVVLALVGGLAVWFIERRWGGSLGGP